MKLVPVAALSLFAVAATGCAGLPAPDLREMNASNLDRLRPGMSRQEVTGVMGSGTETVQEAVVFELHLAGYLQLEVSNPYQVELLESGGDDYEILYYYAEVGGMCMGFWDRSYREKKVQGRFLTPVVLKNGRLVGWGWEILVQEGLKEPPTPLRQNESLLTGS